MTGPREVSPTCSRDVTWRIRSTFAVLSAMQATLLFAMMIIVVALPEIQGELQFSAADGALVNAAYPVSFCGLLLVAGRLGDVYGHRRALIVGLIVFAVGSTIAVVGVSLGAFLLTRLLQGVGAALAAPAGTAIVGRLYLDRGRYARAIAVWGALPMVGGTVGLLVGGPLVSWGTWRAVFLVPAGAAMVAAVVLLCMLGADPIGRRREVGLIGALLATVAIGAVCYGFIDGGHSGWRATNLFAVGAGVVAGVVYVMTQAGSRDPLVPLGLLRSHGMLTGLFAMAAGATGVFSVSYFIPQYLIGVLGFTPAHSSIAYVPYSLAVIAALVLGRPFLDRFGPRVLAVVGLLVGAAGLLLLATISSYSPADPAMAGMVLFPLGALLTFSGAAVIALKDVESDYAGIAGGLLNAATELGPTIGYAVLVAIFASWATPVSVGGVSATSGIGPALSVASALFVTAAVVVSVGGGRTRIGRRSPWEGEAPR